MHVPVLHDLEALKMRTSLLRAHPVTEAPCLLGLVAPGGAFGAWHYLALDGTIERVFDVGFEFVRANSAAGRVTVATVNLRHCN
jgi:hypothetical protein